MSKQLNNTKAHSEYSMLETDRNGYLNRARECSELTIPTLVPPDGHGSHTKYVTPFQSIGARGVNNLASRLLLALFPANTAFFRLALEEQVLAELSSEKEKTEFEKALAKVERVINKEFSIKAVRVAVFEALKHLIVAGNVLLHVRPDGGVKVFHLDKYVVRRDGNSDVLDIIVKETFTPETVPEIVKQMLVKMGIEHDGRDYHEKEVEIYTHVFRNGKKWGVYQEVNGEVIPGSEGSYPLDNCPWIPLRFIRVDGCDYGRGHVEEYLGDLRSLESLTQSIVEGSAASAKVLFLLNPGGYTQKRSLEAPNGSVVSGSDTDISVLQVQKHADFNVAMQVAKEVSDRLSYAFLLNSSVQRSGERVTATEIEKMTAELESQVSGLYSLLSQELQLPLVKQYMRQLSKARKIPSLPKDTVQPIIITGVEALGRGNDLSKLDMLIQGIAQFGPEMLMQYMNMSDYIARRATALGIDTEGLIKSEEQLAKEKQQQQMMAMAQQLGPEVVKGAMHGQGQNTNPEAGAAEA